jgi:hypothetical protein
MRNLSILAFIGFSIIFSGCGTIRTAAIAIHHDTCIAHYNMFVCATPAPPAAIESDKPCVGTAVRSSTSATMTTFGSVGTKGCKLLHQQLQIKSLKSKAGTKCSINNNQEVVCAGLNGPIALAFLLLFALGRVFPRTRVACGVIAMVIGIVTCVSDANAKCTELSSFEEAHKTGDMFAPMRFNATASIAKPMLDMMLNEDAQPSIRKFAIKMINDHYFCNVGNDPKAIMEKITATKDFLNLECKKEGDEVKCAGLNHPGALLLVLFFFLLARLEGNRSVSVIVLSVMGCLVASFADAATKDGCTLNNERVYEAIENSCTPDILMSLIEEVDLECTEEHRMEGASLSMAAAAGGLLPKADLRLRFLEALCWKMQP